MNTLKNPEEYKEKYFVNYNSLHNFTKNLVFRKKTLKFSTKIRKDNVLINHYNTLKKIKEFPYKLNMVFGLPTMNYYQTIKNEDDLKGRLLILKYLSDVEQHVTSNNNDEYPNINVDELNDDELLGVYKTLFMILGIEEIISNNNEVFSLKKLIGG